MFILRELLVAILSLWEGGNDPKEWSGMEFEYARAQTETFVRLVGKGNAKEVLTASIPYITQVTSNLSSPEDIVDQMLRDLCNVIGIDEP